jgi:acyl carrier protein
MRAAIHDRLQSIFRRVFEKDDLVLRDSMTSADIPEWDSLAQINLVVGSEEEFKVRFSTAEIRASKNVGEFKELIARKLGQ